jgi:hypothetical protein
MHDYLALSHSIAVFLQQKDWVIRAEIPNKTSIWEDTSKTLEITIPKPDLINHPQSHTLIHEAIGKLSFKYNIEEQKLLKLLSQGKVDVFHIRASGENIQSGKISFAEGIQSYQNLYSLIKDSARINLKIKGKKAVIDQYLDGINMLAPSAGSFIYSLESSLLENLENSDNHNTEDLGSAGRHINLKFAGLIEKLFLISNNEKYLSAIELITNKIDYKICKHFLYLFNNKTDNLDFEFIWSSSEPLEADAPNKIIFNKTNRKRILGYKETLKSSTIKTYSNLPACIEQFVWHRDDDEGRISIRITIDGTDYVCSIMTPDVNRFEELKAVPIKQQVFISADIIKSTSSKTTVEILELHSIQLPTQQIINFPS